MAAADIFVTSYMVQIPPLLLLALLAASVLIVLAIGGVLFYRYGRK